MSKKGYDGWAVFDAQNNIDVSTVARTRSEAIQAFAGFANGIE